MKKYFLLIFLSFLINTSVLARSTGCKEGNCENGYGKWVYTDKTTYEGEWTGTKKNRKAKAANGSLLSTIGFVVINADDHRTIKMSGKIFIIIFYKPKNEAKSDKFNLI